MALSLVQHESMGFADKQFGGYRLIKRIGHGGFADIYLAQHIHVRRYAVVKIPRGPLNHKVQQHFLEEARLHMALSHKHIVRAFDFNTQDGAPYIIMQLAANGSLRAMHPAGTKLPLPIILRYVQQVADALTYLHQRNIVHHDIKPENMLLDANHNVLLTDFGLATIIDQTLPRQSEEFVGTLAYTAPERFLDHDAPTPASDQYSLGIVVYEWLAGRRPFQGSAGHIMQQHLHASPPPLCLSVPDIPPQVESVILKALHKDPAQRFPDVQAFVDALSDADESSLQADTNPTETFSHLHDTRPIQTSSDRSSSATWSWDLAVLDGALVADLFIATLAGISTYLFLHNENMAWNVFAFCMFVIPVVHAFVRKKLLDIVVFFAILLLSVVSGTVLHILSLLPFILLLWIAVFAIAVAICDLCRPPQRR